jgi:hypothetical protein
MRLRSASLNSATGRYVLHEGRSELGAAARPGASPAAGKRHQPGPDRYAEEGTECRQTSTVPQ